MHLRAFYTWNGCMPKSKLPLYCCFQQSRWGVCPHLRRSFPIRSCLDGDNLGKMHTSLLSCRIIDGMSVINSLLAAMVFRCFIILDT